MNVSCIPNLEPATCPFVFHPPLRPPYPSISFEINDSSHGRASRLYIYIAVVAYYLNKSCGSVNTYLLYWLENARPPFYARNLAPPGRLVPLSRHISVHGFLLSVTWRSNAFPPKHMEDI